jgi:hypothetical protein
MLENDEEVLDYRNTLPPQLSHSLRRTANFLHYLGIILFIPSTFYFFFNFFTLFRAYGVENSSRYSPQYFTSLQLSLMTMGFVIFLSIISFLHGNQIKAISRNRISIEKIFHYQENHWMILSVLTTMFIALYIFVLVIQ